MSPRRLIDTNIIVRYLTQDHAKHAAVAGKLFAACDRGLPVATFDAGLAKLREIDVELDA